MVDEETSAHVSANDDDSSQANSLHAPSHVPHVHREAEFQRRLAEKHARTWRHRRVLFCALQVIIGCGLPTGSVLFAAGIASGQMWSWATGHGAMSVMLTMACGLLSSVVIFLWGWGIIRGMIAFALSFIVVVSVTRAVIGELLPAMPGLASLFIMTGVIVGYLTVLEEGD